MFDILCALFVLTSAAFCWFGLIHCVHWLARVSSTPTGRRWWFWVATLLVTLAGFAVTMYHGIFGLVRLAYGVVCLFG